MKYFSNYLKKIDIHYNKTTTTTKKVGEYMKYFSIYLKRNRYTL